MPSVGILLHYMASVSDVTFQNLNERSGNFIFIYGFMVTEKDYAKYIALAIAKETPKAFFKN
jgi:hypothetical protein